MTPPESALDLERLSDEEFWRFARERAQSAPGRSPLDDARPEQYLECLLLQGRCLLPLSAIDEVMVSPPSYTLLPAMPRWMPGLAAWRGEIMAVVHLEAYLAGGETTMNGGMLLITRHPELNVALYVPALGRTLTLAGNALIPITDAPELAGASIIAGVIEDIPVLDIFALLTDIVQQVEAEAWHD